MQTLLCSEDIEERKEAVKKILAIRHRSGNPDIGNMTVRQRYNPKKFNFEATTLHQILPKEEYKFEPPMTLDIPTTELKNFINTPMVVTLYDGNTQGTERAIKKTTAAAESVVGQARRDGQILGQQVASHLIAKLNSKQDLVNLVQAPSTSYKDSIKGRSTKPP